MADTFFQTTRGISRRRFLRWSVFALVWGMAVTCAAGASAAPPQRFLLGTPALSVVDGVLSVDCPVGVDNEDGLRDLLKDGAMLELRVSYELERKRSWWSNAGVVSGVFVSRLRHDPLTREFLLTMPGDGREILHKDRNLTRLLYATWRTLRLPITPERIFQGDDVSHEYLVTLDFELRHTELPPWLEKSPGLWSANVVPRETRELTYRR